MQECVYQTYTALTNSTGSWFSSGAIWLVLHDRLAQILHTLLQKYIGNVESARWFFLGSAATQLRWCGRFYIIYVQWLFLIEMVTTRYHKNRSGLLFGNHRPPRQKLGVKYDTEGLTYQPKIVYTQKSLVSLIIRQQFFLHRVPTVSKCNKVAFTWAHQGMVYVQGFQRQPSPSFLSTTSLPPATVWTYQQYALHVYSFLTYRLTWYIYFLLKKKNLSYTVKLHVKSVYN